MIGYLFIANEKIGEVDFKIIADSMGVIGGVLLPNHNYVKYQSTIQEHYERNGISNIHDFNFKILLDDTELKPSGGIGVTDSKEFDEIYVECGGLDQITLEKLRLENSNHAL
jgi:hypothetical protein